MVLLEILRKKFPLHLIQGKNCASAIASGFLGLFLFTLLSHSDATDKSYTRCACLRLSRLLNKAFFPDNSRDYLCFVSRLVYTD